MLTSAPLLRVAAIVALLTATPAGAHGPTMRLAYDGVRPPQLAIRAGQTVHFVNASTTPRTFTLVADDSSFESPPLPRGEGWHHTFEAPGTYEIHVKEHPSLRASIVVAPEN